jgi:hypothetical protein
MENNEQNIDTNVNNLKIQNNISDVLNKKLGKDNSSNV